MAPEKNVPPQAPKISIPAKISAVMLLIAVLHGSWDYYDLLRVVVCLSAGYIAWFARQQQRERLFWIMVVVAIIYNPVAPLHFEHGLWTLLNIIGAILFWLAATDPKRIS